MAFRFAWLVELLQAIEGNKTKKAVTTSRAVNPDNQVIITWYNRYNHRITRHGESAIAFLSCLFPEHRSDRVYALQERRLSSIFGRALGLGHSRAARLNQWRQRNGKDFPTCVEDVMAECEFAEPTPENEVTLEQIHAVLTQIAANSGFSSPELRTTANSKSADELLTPILRRLQSHEAKWLVRMVLKDYSPVQIPEWLAMHNFHFMLNDILAIQNSFSAAVAILGSANIRGLPARPNKDYERALKQLVARDMVPQLGIMVKRQPFDKARSIKHCCKMSGSRAMSIERKYDGEYCQIHIDVTKGNDCIKIFSKSGRDSTMDRCRLHSALKESLRLDRDGCKIKEKCILEGELLVWNRSKRTIEPFYKIRRHVQHGGRWLGADVDSPAKHDEQVMIVFYDILLLDERNFTNEPHRKRRQHLKGLVERIEGVADIAQRAIIDFSSGRAPEKLRSAFAECIRQRWEGYVLKACEAPYFACNVSSRGIKLKKDYIAGLGDTADLCLVGGRRDPKVEQELGIGPLSWTMFYVGCLDNKDQVKRYDAKPRFQIIDILTHHSMCKQDMLDLNMKGKFLEIPYQPEVEELEVKMACKSMQQPTELFKDPFIVEIMGAGFERPSNARYFTLRFPRKISERVAVKIHSDRCIADTTSFDELQELAEQSMAAPVDFDSQEDARWIERLEKADPRSKYTDDRSQSTTPGRSPTSATTASISPVKKRRRPAPPMIRADTQEVRSCELVRRKTQTQTTTPSTATPDSLSSIGSKRKPHTWDVSPTVAISSKRRRVSQSTVPTTMLDARPESRRTISSPLPHQHNNSTETSLAVHARIIENSEMPVIEATTVLPFEPPTVFRLPKNPQKDKGRTTKGICQLQTAHLGPTALSEVTNLSPQHTRGSIKPRKSSPKHNSKFLVQKLQATQPPLPTPPSSADNDKIARIKRDLLQRAVTQTSTVATPMQRTRTARHHLRQPDVPWSTMPTSDPAEAEAEADHADYTPKQTVLAAVPQQHAPKPPLPLPLPPSTTINLARTPILLSSSLTAALQNPTRRIHDLLRHRTATFTYSLPHFVEQVTTPPTTQSTKNAHLMLVDISKPSFVAEDLRSLRQNLADNTAKRKEGPTGASAKVLLMDYHILRSVKNTNNALDIEAERRLFAGGLRLHVSAGAGGGTEEEVGVVVEILWDWRDAVE